VRLPGQVLEVLELRGMRAGAFAAWLEGVRRRYLEGEALRVLVSRDGSHAVLLAG
jgi:hypothetical protein